MNARAHQRSAGFTLIEIMVALFILGLIVAAVYSSWTAIVRGSKTGLDAAAAVQRSRTAIRSIVNALTCSRSFASDVELYGFIGENGPEASLSFVARLPKSFPRGGKFGDFDVRRVTFSLEPGPDYSSQLVLRQNPILMDQDIDEREHPVVLARNVKKFEMEFLEKIDSREWLDQWTLTNQLPRKVKVTIQFGGSNPRSPVREEVTRVVDLPAVTVQSTWQMPTAQPRPGGPVPPPIRLR